MRSTNFGNSDWVKGSRFGRPGLASADAGLVDLNTEAVGACERKEYQRAEGLCLMVLNRDPQNTDAKQTLGVTFANTGRVQPGIQLLLSVLEVDSNSSVANYWLGVLYRNSGEFALSREYASRACALNPNDGDALVSLAKSQASMGQPRMAIISLSRAIELKPFDAEGHQCLGIELNRLGRSEEAIASFRMAVELAPNWTDPYVTLARLHKEGRRMQECLDCLAAVSLVVGQDPHANLSLSVRMMVDGLVEEAESFARKVIELEPNNGIAFALLGSILKQLGRFEEAVIALERAIQLRPAAMNPHVDLLICRRAKEKHRPLLNQIASVLDSPSLGPVGRRSVHYALGKAHNDLREFGTAMQHFDRANGLMLEQLGKGQLDRSVHTRAIDRMITTFTKERLEQSQIPVMDSDMPILVVGMIRSGTTLLEQIISNHPNVAAGGELTYLTQRAKSVFNIETGELDPDEATKYAQGYLELLAGIGNGSQYVTDKLPNNFLVLGLIHMLLPNARIIHCRRHPLDTCVSIYTTPFDDPINYAHDRDSIVYFYKEYQLLMEHWRSVILPDRLLEIDYEDLVMDGEPVIRQVLDFCGLDWSNSCLHHEENKGTIRTPSWWQARQPIYTTSVGRWRNYEPWLGEFRELLDQRIPARDEVKDQTAQLM